MNNLPSFSTRESSYETLHCFYSLYVRVDFGYLVLISTRAENGHLDGSLIENNTNVSRRAFLTAALLRHGPSETHFSLLLLSNVLRFSVLRVIIHKLYSILPMVDLF